MVVGPEVESTDEVPVREFAGGLYAVARCQGVASITSTWQGLVGWLAVAAGLFTAVGWAFWRWESVVSRR